MDETIITYYYLDTNREITESEPAKPITNETDQNKLIWKTVDGLNYKRTFESERFKISHSGVKPLKLTYNILYDISGNPYNNLNIKNDNDISFNLYIFKPKKCENNEKYSSYSFPINKMKPDQYVEYVANELFTISQNNNIETLEISSNTFSNIYEDKIEFIFQEKNQYDISENTLYNNLENSINWRV